MLAGGPNSGAGVVDVAAFLVSAAGQVDFDAADQVTDFRDFGVAGCGFGAGPEQRWRCRVPVGDLRTLAKRAAVWRLDQLTGGWTQVKQRFRPDPASCCWSQPGRELRPRGPG